MKRFGGLSLIRKNIYPQVQPADTMYGPQKIAGSLRADHAFVYAIVKNEGGNLMGAYCVKCRAKREMKDPKSITMKNGRPATQGICPVCGTKMFKIGKA